VVLTSDRQKASARWGLARWGHNTNALGDNTKLRGLKFRCGPGGRLLTMIRPKSLLAGAKEC